MRHTCPNCGFKPPRPEHTYFGDLPYGLMRDPNDRTKTIKNVNEFATIDTICHRYRQGDSMRAIERWLAGTGILTRAGTNWSVTQISRILDREGLT